MSAQDTSPSLGAGLVAALCLSVGGAAAAAALAPFFGSGAALRLAVALLGFVYVLYVLKTSHERVGRIATAALWLAAACVTWLAGLPLAAYALVHVGLAWLVRSLYRYSGLAPALADFGLSLLGAALAAWAAQRSGSVWLALWCFFLAQAFHVLIPASFAGRGRSPEPTDDAFARAHRAAESAVRRLTATH